MTDYLYQCKLVQEANGGKSIIVAWIDERGAFVDALVELKGEIGFWVVKEVYPGKHSFEWVRENVAKAHKGTRAFSDI